MILRNKLNSPLVLGPRVRIEPGKTLELPEGTRFASTVERWIANGWVEEAEAGKTVVPVKEPKAEKPKAEEPKSATPAKKPAKKAAKKADDEDK